MEHKKFITLPKIQSLQLVRNANKILLNNYKFTGDKIIDYRNLSELQEKFFLSENKLSMYLNKN